MLEESAQRLVTRALVCGRQPRSHGHVMITLLKMQHGFWVFFFCKMNNLKRGLNKEVSDKSHLPVPPWGGGGGTQLLCQGGVGGSTQGRKVWEDSRLNQFPHLYASNPQI